MNATTARNLLLSALVFFGIIVFMILTGCIAVSFGASESFFCNVYCHIGRVLMVSGFVYVAYRVIRDLRHKKS